MQRNHPLPRSKTFSAPFGLVLALAFGLVFAYGWAIMVIWGAIAEVFDGPTIGYWTAVAVSLGLSVVRETLRRSP